MNLIAKIASRFVFDRKNEGDDSAARGFVSFISAISVTGLALGVTALLVVTSVMNGFEKEMKSVLTLFHGHVLLFSRTEPVENPVQFAEKMKVDFKGIKAVSPYFFMEAMLSSPTGIAGTMIEGVHLPSLSQVSSVEKKITSGRMVAPVADAAAFPEIVLGSELARRLRVQAGDSVILTIPFARALLKSSSGANDSGAIVRKFQVVGVLKLGMYDYDNKYALTEIGAIQTLLEQPNRANAFKIITDDMFTSHLITAQMNEKFVYPMRARDWSTLNRNLFYAIKLEKVVIAIILLAIVLVASFNIISTLLMMVHDKKRQIAMLKTMGFAPKWVLGVFLLIGTVMASMGVLLGCGLAQLICHFMRWKSIIDLPPDIYGLSRLPIEFRTGEWIAICVFSILLALLSTLWPSIRISRRSPIEGIRYE